MNHWLFLSRIAPAEKNDLSFRSFGGVMDLLPTCESLTNVPGGDCLDPSHIEGSGRSLVVVYSFDKSFYILSFSLRFSFFGNSSMCILIDILPLFFDGYGAADYRHA
jgi:hypothetical protein